MSVKGPTIIERARTEAVLEDKVNRLQADLSELRASLQNNGAARFNADDQIFLVWVLGFSAGAHIERNGEQGERIFARCRDLFVKLHNNGGNAS